MTPSDLPLALLRDSGGWALLKMHSPQTARQAGHKESKK